MTARVVRVEVDGRDRVTEVTIKVAVTRAGMALVDGEAFTSDCPKEARTALFNWLVEGEAKARQAAH